jgi:hypothetical protein
MLTRLGEFGVDAFTIVRIAGHGSIVVPQRTCTRPWKLSNAHLSGCSFTVPGVREESLQFSLQSATRCL